VWIQHPVPFFFTFPPHPTSPFVVPHVLIAHSLFGNAQVWCPFTVLSVCGSCSFKPSPAGHSRAPFPCVGFRIASAFPVDLFVRNTQLKFQISFFVWSTGPNHFLTPDFPFFPWSQPLFSFWPGNTAFDVPVDPKGKGPSPPMKSGGTGYFLVGQLQTK